MELAFNRGLEYKLYLEEIDAFIEHELDHIARQILAYAGTGEFRDEQFVRSARRYVTALRDAHGVAVNGLRHEEFRPKFLEQFPSIIRDLTTAIWQRHEPEPTRAFALATRHPRFAPSEVTLEYPVTIRSAEAVNEYYHARVRGFYPAGLPCEPPLVNLSGGAVALLQQRTDFSLSTTYAEFEEGLDSARQRRLLQIFFDLSAITLPRWSSQHIRTYALAAHEHFHRVLGASGVLTAWAKARYKKQEPDEKLQVIDKVWADPDLSEAVRRPRQQTFLRFLKEYETFGEPLVELAGRSYDFFHRVWKFYQEQMVRPDATNEVEPLRTIAEWHAQELLADVAALVIAGPAFAVAFHTVFIARTAEEFKELFTIAGGSPAHPPTLLRVRFHLDLLHRFGFKDVAARLETQFSGWEAETASQSAFLDAYRRFLIEDVAPTGARDCLDRIIDLIGDIASDAACYDLGKRANSSAAHRSEAELQTWWQTIARRVEKDGAFLPADAAAFAPSDVINAIWWKRAAEGGAEPKNRLAWRVALRNYQDGKEEAGIPA